MVKFLITLCGKLNCSHIDETVIDDKIDKKIFEYDSKIFEKKVHPKSVVDEKIERLCDKIKHNTEGIDKIEEHMCALRIGLDGKFDNVQSTMHNNNKVLLEILTDSSPIKRKKLFFLL